MLKYKFIVTYKNGRRYAQNDQDTSYTKDGASAFYDVKVEDIDIFELFGAGASVMVDMSDGSFNVNNQRIHLYDGPIENRQVVYFRRNKINILENKQSTTFHIGWEGLNPLTGEKVQRVIILE